MCLPTGSEGVTVLAKVAGPGPMGKVGHCDTIGARRTRVEPRGFPEEPLTTPYEWPMRNSGTSIKTASLRISNCRNKVSWSLYQINYLNQQKYREKEVIDIILGLMISYRSRYYRDYILG